MQTKHKKQRRQGRIKKRMILLFAILTAVAVVLASSQFVQKNQDNFLKRQYPMEYSEYVEKYSNEYGIPPSLVYAVIRTESKFDPEAGSSAGALGLMQIIPETFEWLQMRRGSVGDYVTDDLFEPEINIDYGTYFLSYLLEKYESEESAIAAYNAGPGAVDEWLATIDYSADSVNIDYIPYPETREYVKRVTAAREMYQELYGLI